MIDACRICSHTGKFVHYQVHEMMYGTRETFDYFKCSSCGCLQISATPVDLARHYPPDYYSYATKPDDPWVGRARRKLNVALAKRELFQTHSVWFHIAQSLIDPPKELQAIGPLLKRIGLRSLNASFLDVGCGSRSWWLDQLSALGFRNLRGVDPFIEKTRQWGSSVIIKGNLDEIQGHYDVISFHHSLEHIPDQSGALNAAARLLRSDGSLVVRVPTVSSTVWKEYGVDWVELDAPRHLYLHSHTSLKIAAERAGLAITEMHCDSVDFEFWGSEQYRRGIPLRAPGSFATDPAESVFSYREMGEFRRKAKEANANLLGGRIVAILRHSG
jgi:SAM-dependent methyltransferase